VKILDKRRAALAAAVATAAVAMGVPAATASAAPMPVGLPPSVTCPPWYGLYSIAGLGCIPWWEVWLQQATTLPFRADQVTQ
jgi:ABC-type sugar transport system substrate-binding protein